MAKSLTLMLLSLAVATSMTSAEAGVFRDRVRFNEQGDGFWMKGRCVIPGNDWADNAIIKDLGCIVKIRKGKRRPRREDANVTILSEFYGIRTGTFGVIGENRNTCFEAGRCDNKGFRIVFETATPVTVELQGMLACISGWKDDVTEAHWFIKEVGRVPGRTSRDWLNFETRCANLARNTPRP